jgi:hypothetical protein
MEKAARMATEVQTYGWVYFIHAPEVGRIKIGYTDGQPLARLRDLNCGSPVALVGLGIVAGTYAGERELHERFAGLRRRLEWFEAAPALLRFIRTHARPWPKERIARVPVPVVMPPRNPGPPPTPREQRTLSASARRHFDDVVARMHADRAAR